MFVRYLATSNVFEFDLCYGDIAVVSVDNHTLKFSSQLQGADDHTNKSWECLETKLRDAKDSKRTHDPFYEKLYSIFLGREAFKNRTMRRRENY